ERDPVGVYHGGGFAGFRIAPGDGAAELQPVAVKVAHALEQSRGPYEAASEPPGLFEGGGVSSLLGEGGLPFRQLASGRFQYRKTGVQSFGRRLSEQIGGEVQLLPRRLQLLDQRQSAHLIAIRRSGPRKPDLCWWPPDPVCTCRSGTRQSMPGRGWPESTRKSPGRVTIGSSCRKTRRCRWIRHRRAWGTYRFLRDSGSGS